jgi:hypothetical protein
VLVLLWVVFYTGTTIHPISMIANTRVEDRFERELKMWAPWK